MGKRSQEEIQAQKDAEVKAELEALEQRFSAELLALEKFEPISVNLEGSNHLHSILESIKLSFLGHSLTSFFDVSWSLSTEQVTISSSILRFPGGRSHILDALTRYQVALNEWLNASNKVTNFKIFIQIKVENESLRAKVRDLESRLENSRREYERQFVGWPFPRGHIMGVW